MGRRTVCQIIDGQNPAKIKLLNTGGNTVSFDPLVAAIQTVECPRVLIPAGGEVSLDLEGIAKLREWNIHPMTQ